VRGENKRRGVRGEVEVIQIFIRILL